MNLDLLRPFDLEAAKRGEEICLDTNDSAVTLAAEAGPDGHHVVRWEDGNLHFTRTDRLRMKPYGWCEEKPVYRGDVLYYLDYGGCSYKVEQTIKVIGMNPRDGGKGIEGTILYTSEKVTEGSTTWAPVERWTWTKPEPVKKTRTVKFLGYLAHLGAIVLYAENSAAIPKTFKRVPGADVTYEAEE